MSETRISKRRPQRQAAAPSSIDADLDLSSGVGEPGTHTHCELTGAAFVDIGANLTDPVFKGIYHGKRKHEEDLERVLERAKKQGVFRILVTGGSLSESRDALELCNRFDPDQTFLYATVGVHPTKAAELEMDVSSLQKMRQLIAENAGRVAAIGELGLDYERLQFCDADTQRRSFALQLQLVAEFKLPMFLHMRAAAADFVDILNRHRACWEGVTGVVHSFTGTKEEMKKLLDLGLEIGLNGCSLKTAENLDVARSVPLESLHFETDAPWCGIRPSHASHSLLRRPLPRAVKAEKLDRENQENKDTDSTKDKIYESDEERCNGFQVKDRNEPANIIQVAEVVFSLHTTHQSFPQFCRRVASNSTRVFPKLGPVVGDV